jgi:tetratricopeptide (TPR) repeat protein
MLYRFSLFVFMLSGVVLGQDQAFQAGNNAYQRNDFATALQKYHQIAATGKQSDALFYNMANAYYRRGQLGPAILYYQKAKQLNPYHAKIAHSLEIAQSKTKNQIAQVPEAFWTTAWRYLYWIFGLSGFFWSAIVFYVVVILLIAHQIWFRTESPWRRRALMICAPMLFFLMAATFFASFKSEERNFAVIQPKKSELFATPVLEAQSIKVVYEGLTLKITERAGAWFRVRLPNGVEGWIQKKDVALI